MLTGSGVKRTATQTGQFNFNKCRKDVRHKWIPVVIEIPAGSLLFLSAIMHAGYGIWAIDNALVNFVPSMDDLRRTKVEELLKRSQAHASRPLVLQEKGNRSIDPTVTERAGVNPAAASERSRSSYSTRRYSASEDKELTSSTTPPNLRT